MIRSDIHMHSYYSGDSTAPTEDMVKAALEKGLSFICFTEHNDFDFPYENCPNMEDGLFDLNVDSYLFELLNLRDKYKDKIEIGFGVEIGLLDRCLEKNSKLVNDYDFDFVIGSNHVCDNEDPWQTDFWDTHSVKDAITMYFEDNLRFVSNYNDYDVFGHIDYITRYIPMSDEIRGKEFAYSYEDYKELIDETLNSIIKNGKGIEINTSGLRPGRSIPATNPMPAIIKRYKELGGKIITIGADAHKPADIAFEFDKAEKILKECGFNGYHIFKKRKPEFIEF